MKAFSSKGGFFSTPLSWVQFKMSVGSVVRIIKSNTARDLKKQYPFLKKCYFGTQSVWSDGYFVSTVGVNEAVIQRYIEYQGREDLGQAWLDLK